MFKYVNNEQLRNEIKKSLIDNGVTQKEVADRMEVKPQQFTNIVNKENLAFRDLKRICNAMDCDLVIDIVKRK